MVKNNWGKAFYRGSAWSVADNFFRQAVTLGVFVILARLLEPTVFGLLSVALLIVQVFKSVAIDSIATAVVRKSDAEPRDFDTAFWMCLGVSAPVFGLLLATAGIFERWMDIEGLAGVMRGTSVMILTSGLSRVHEAWLTQQMRFRTLSVRSSLSVALGGACAITLAYRGYGIQSLVMQQVVTAVAEGVLLWCITPWRPTLRASRRAFGEIFRFGRHVALTALTNFANQHSDTFFVSYFLGSAATGFYTAGKRISNTLNTVISSAFLRVSLPAFAKLQHDTPALGRAFLEATRLTATITAPLFVGLALLSRDITLLMLGEKWLKAVEVMQIVTLVGFLTSIGYYNQSIMLARNKPQWQTRLTLLYAVTNVAAFTVFARYGLAATALAFAVRALVLYPVSAWCALQLTAVPWRRYVRGLLPPVGAAAAMALVLLGTAPFLADLLVAARMGILVLLGGVSYGLTLYAVSPAHHRQMVVQAVRGRFLIKQNANY